MQASDIKSLHDLQLPGSGKARTICPHVIDDHTSPHEVLQLFSLYNFTLPSA